MIEDSKMLSSWFFDKNVWFWLGTTICFRRYSKKWYLSIGNIWKPVKYFWIRVSNSRCTQLKQNVPNICYRQSTRSCTIVSKIRVYEVHFTNWIYTLFSISWELFFFNIHSKVIDTLCGNCMYLSFICLFKTDVLFYERKRYKLDLLCVPGKMGLSVFYHYLDHFSFFRLDFFS